MLPWMPWNMTHNYEISPHSPHPVILANSGRSTLLYRDSNKGSRMVKWSQSKFGLICHVLFKLLIFLELPSLLFVQGRMATKPTFGRREVEGARTFPDWIESGDWSAGSAANCVYTHTRKGRVNTSVHPLFGNPDHRCCKSLVKAAIIGFSSLLINKWGPFPMIRSSTHRFFSFLFYCASACKVWARLSQTSVKWAPHRCIWWEFKPTLKVERLQEYQKYLDSFLILLFSPKNKWHTLLTELIFKRLKMFQTFHLHGQLVSQHHFWNYSHDNVLMLCSTEKFTSCV